MKCVMITVYIMSHYDVPVKQFYAQVSCCWHACVVVLCVDRVFGVAVVVPVAHAQSWWTSATSGDHLVRGDMREKQISGLNDHDCTHNGKPLLLSVYYTRKRVVYPACTCICVFVNLECLVTRLISGQAMLSTAARSLRCESKTCFLWTANFHDGLHRCISSSKDSDCAWRWRRGSEARCLGIEQCSR